MGKSSEENDPDIIELDLEQFHRANPGANANRADSFTEGKLPTLIPNPLSIIEGMFGLPSFGTFAGERSLFRNFREAANEPFNILSAIPSSITIVIQESDPDMVSEDGMSTSFIEQLRRSGLDF